ncbi:type II secretion system protein N [Reinekea blandensis]|uniref:General secretion pathway protein C n=1 Tax=Reinekea blandensis MED297 TaxID=314283 RepID=A4BER9_9GAMM|nr:type II secretion system protein N [Reinekea blandensis]EAR09496.1 general secretion pathway protein C [Reinekea sp. MED297] [Reinekea blandensis MED297]
MELYSQLQKIWPPMQSLLVGLATILCGVWLAQITWMILDPQPELAAPTIRPASSTSSNAGTNWQQLGSQLSQREFFGDVVVEAAEEPTEVVDAPETNLNLTLQAVMATGEGRGFAVIGERSGSGKVFGVGDDLFGQAALQAVYGDRVIIDRRGQLETLRYEELSSSLLQSVSNSRDDVIQTDSADSFQEALSQANEQVARGGDLASSVQGMVNYVTQRANEDPAAFVQEMGLEATSEGYQVTRRARQLQMVGLRPGDIVTSVNDQPVGNIQSDQALLNQILQTGGELKIQIRRGSRSFTIYQSIPTF